MAAQVIAPETENRPFPSRRRPLLCGLGRGGALRAVGGKNRRLCALRTTGSFGRLLPVISRSRSLRQRGLRSTFHKHLTRGKGQHKDHRFYLQHKRFTSRGSGCYLKIPVFVCRLAPAPSQNTPKGEPGGPEGALGEGRPRQAGGSEAASHREGEEARVERRRAGSTTQSKSVCRRPCTSMISQHALKIRK